MCLVDGRCSMDALSITLDSHKKLELLNTSHSFHVSTAGIFSDVGLHSQNLLSGMQSSEEILHKLLVF